MPAEKLKKGQTQALLPVLQLREHFILRVYITHTYNCGRAWLCDYGDNSTVLQLNSCSVVLHHSRIKVQPMGVAGQWRNGVGTRHICIRWILELESATILNGRKQSKNIGGSLNKLLVTLYGWGLWHIEDISKINCQWCFHISRSLRQACS